MKFSTTIVVATAIPLILATAASASVFEGASLINNDDQAALDAVVGEGDYYLLAKDEGDGLEGPLSGGFSSTGVGSSITAVNWKLETNVLLTEPFYVVFKDGSAGGTLVYRYNDPDGIDDDTQGGAPTTDETTTSDTSPYVTYQSMTYDLSSGNPYTAVEDGITQLNWTSDDQLSHIAIFSTDPDFGEEIPEATGLAIWGFVGLSSVVMARRRRRTV